MTNSYEAALLTATGGGSPAPDAGAAPAPDTNAAPAAPQQPAPSLELPEQQPAVEGWAQLSEEQKFDLAEAAKQNAAANGGAAPAGDQPTAPTAPNTGAFDEATFFGEKTGGKFKSWDEIVPQLEKAPVTVEVVKAPEFINEESKKVYELIAAGKIDEVTPILQQRAFISNLANQEPRTILAAHIKEEYPSLTAEQINYEIDRRYSVKESDYDEDPLGLSTAKAMAADRMKLDSEKAKTYFTSKLGELKFPDHSPVGQQPRAAAEPDLSTPEAKKALDFVTGLPELTKSEKLSFSYQSDSPVNPITVGGDILFPQEKITAIKDAIGDHPELYILNRFFSKDGTFDGDKFAQAIYKIENTDEIIAQAASQSLTQTQKEMLIRSKNYNPSLNAPGGDFDKTADQSNREAMERFFNIPAATAGSPV